MHTKQDWEPALRASLKRRWKCYRRALKHCQRKFSERTLHDSRVETRRLLSLVGLLSVLLGPRHLKLARRRLKAHLNAFDPLRDTQVQLRLLGRHRTQFPEIQKLYEKHLKREKRCLKTAQRRIDRVRFGQLEKVVKALSCRLVRPQDDPIRRAHHRLAVLGAVHRTFNRTVELQRAMDPGEVETIHRTRIAFKKFHYMVEALQPIFPVITTERVTAMQTFQSMLGEVQDTEVFLARFDKFVRRHESLAQKMVRFRHWLLLRQTKQIDRCIKHADELHAFWPLESRGIREGSRRRVRQNRSLAT